MVATGRDLTASEIGCYLSHVKVWQMALTRTHEWALVLEDDAIIGARLEEVLAQVGHLPANWEVVNLQRDWARQPFSRHAFLPGLDVLRHVRVGYLTVGYLIHRRALERLSRVLFPIRWPIDSWHIWWPTHGLVVYRTDGDVVASNRALELTIDDRRIQKQVRGPPSFARRLWRMKLGLLRLYRLTLAVAQDFGVRRDR